MQQAADARTGWRARPSRVEMSALVGVAAVAWCVFAVTAVLVAVDPATSVDHEVQQRVATAASDVAAHAAWLRPLSTVVGRLGSTPVEAAVVVVVTLLSLARGWTTKPVLLCVATYVVVAASVGIAKKAYHRPEPYDELGDPGRSFPSGHSATAVAVYGGLALAVCLTDRHLSSQRRAAVVVLVTVAALVMAAMLVRSAHWLSDIVGGAAVGTAWLATIAAAVTHLGWWDESAPATAAPDPRRG